MWSAGQRYQIGFREITGTVPVFHPDVRVWEVVDTPSNTHRGLFYFDTFARSGKRSGAWASHYRSQRRLDEGATPLVSNNNNFLKGRPGEPVLVSLDDTRTLFHEFGHSLHALLQDVTYEGVAGTPRDFVELPSQIMENWTWEREALDLFARHHETGAPIPEDLFQRMRAARNFRSASATMRQVAFAKLDLLLHRRAAEFAAAPDLEAAARAAIADCLIPTQPPAPTILRRFTHIFGDPVGYAAGYYSYKWAEVLEADAFGRFRREGLFNPAVGAEFVRTILSRGNSAPAADLFREFMGRDPDPTALLERAGLAG